MLLVELGPQNCTVMGLGELELRAALMSLAAVRPVFHSEADFQQALAWQVHVEHPDAKVRLETRPIADRPLFLDLAVSLGGSRVAVELKYLVRSLTVTVDNELFQLRAQSAHDVRRYDVVKDVRRLEELVDVGAADVGYAVVLTNDRGYWVEGTKAEPIDAAFRLAEGRTLAGTLAWAATAGAGTMRAREAVIALRGEYALSWAPYSDIGVRGGEFRYLLMAVSRLDPATATS